MDGKPRHPIVPSPKAEVRRRRMLVGDCGKPRALPRGVKSEGASMTDKRVNARQNESKIYSGPTKVKIEYGRESWATRRGCPVAACSGRAGYPCPAVGHLRGRSGFTPDTQGKPVGDKRPFIPDLRSDCVTLFREAQ